MSTLYSILVAIDVLLAIAIIGLVLIQHGKGADAGAAFGSGASGTVFGARGSASFLTKLTTVLAVLFFANSLWLAHLASNRPVAESVIDTLEESTQESPNTDIPSIETLESDIPDSVTSDTDEQANNDVTPKGVQADLPEDADSNINTVTDDASSELQDSINSVKEEVESTLDSITADDVPE